MTRVESQRHKKKKEEEVDEPIIKRDRNVSVSVSMVFAADAHIKPTLNKLKSLKF
jgi:hypothetical protein